LKTNQKLACAIAAVLGGGYSGATLAAEAGASDTSGIEEIVVTAQRRNESLQDVPITIQAITGEQLKSLNVTTIDDLLKYTPNVTYSGNGGGSTGNIFMRGLSSGGSGNQSQSTTAPFPNVALYLDDQSMQFPARNNDVYLVDMQRVEVLEGPQGTLFGGGAQAGAVRYITNKPSLDATEGNVNAGYGTTAGGDPNSNANATLNIPLIPDVLAVRGTIFQDHHGGYISNVPGTIANVEQPNVTASNGALVGSNLNTLDISGFRLSVLLKLNEDWNVLFQQNYQNSNANGYWAEYPNGVNTQAQGQGGCTTAGGCLGTALGQNQIQAFTPAYDKDSYESSAVTINGKIGDIKVVYAGSFMDRHIDQQADYSNYMRSFDGSYYTCTGAAHNGGYFNSSKPTTCYAPVGDWNDNVTNTHQSHELRFSTPEDKVLRGLFGAYYEKFDIYDQMNFNYLPIPQCGPAGSATLTAALGTGPDCLSAVGPIPGYFASNPNLRTGTNSAFGEDVHRGYQQTALFGSVDYDIIPKVLTLTGGTRYYHYDEFETGSEYYSETTSPLILDHPDGACTAAPLSQKGTGPCGFGINLHKSEGGFRSRANITWHITPDIMAYYTFSQGFRPGGFNRTSTGADGTIGLKAEIPYAGKGTDQYYKPVGFNSDNLINNEWGLKTEFLDHRLQINASTYIMHWNNIQLPLFSPPVFGNTTFTVNGPSYTVKGLELQLVARITDGLTIQGSSSWNSSSQTNAPCLTSNIPAADGNPTPIGQCITIQKGQPLANAFGALGTAPAFSPSLMFNIRARYDWNMGAYKPFAWVGANHIGSENNEPASFTPGNTQNIPTTTLLLYNIPGYTTYDGSIGVAKDNWVAQVSGSNLTNSDAVSNVTSGQYIKSEIPVRPRVLTLQFGYKF
jgi:outer membrane receptor protein involved in Fe transport